MAIQGERVATMNAVQKPDAFPFVQWVIASVIIFSGIAAGIGKFIWLPNHITQRAPDGSDFAGKIWSREIAFGREGTAPFIR